MLTVDLEPPTQGLSSFTQYTDEAGIMAPLWDTTNLKIEILCERVFKILSQNSNVELLLLCPFPTPHPLGGGHHDGCLANPN